MSNFDYIAAKEFRESLESDYTEMRNCIEMESWKSAQVLAGSIIEAMLVDYIASTTNSKRTKKDPLKLDLSEAITICRNEDVLSERSADLCSVVKSYRNLIHPGRMIRLEEQPPNKESASVALALIEMITQDLAKKLRASFGLTAEQILSKIKRDNNSIAILKHLLAEVSEYHREQLLITLIPQAHSEAWDLIDPFREGEADALADRLEAAFRIILETVSSDVRKRVSLEFVRILREEDGDQVIEYANAFFRPPDMEFLSDSHQNMVREHLINSLPSTHTVATVTRIKGLGKYIRTTDIQKWVDPIVRTLISQTNGSQVKEEVCNIFLEEFSRTSPLTDEAVLSRIDDWVHHFDDDPDSQNVKALLSLKNDVTFMQIPF